MPAESNKIPFNKIITSKLNGKIKIKRFTCICLVSLAVSTLLLNNNVMVGQELKAYFGFPVWFPQGKIAWTSHSSRVSYTRPHHGGHHANFFPRTITAIVTGQRSRPEREHDFSLMKSIFELEIIKYPICLLQ